MFNSGLQRTCTYFLTRARDFSRLGFHFSTALQENNVSFSWIFRYINQLRIQNRVKHLRWRYAFEYAPVGIMKMEWFQWFTKHPTNCEIISFSQSLWTIYFREIQQLTCNLFYVFLLFSLYLKTLKFTLGRKKIILQFEAKYTLFYMQNVKCMYYIVWHEYENPIQVVGIIAIRNRKIVWKHGPYCWYFHLNLKYLDGRTKHTSKQQKRWLLCGIGSWKWLWSCFSHFLSLWPWNQRFWGSSKDCYRSKRVSQVLLCLMCYNFLNSQNIPINQ